MNPDRYAALMAIGCACCQINDTRPAFGFVRVPLVWPIKTEAHHLNSGGVHGGKRLGDDETVPACSWHHRGTQLPGMTKAAMTALYGPSWAGGSKPFRAVYGQDADLLRTTNQLIETVEVA